MPQVFHRYFFVISTFSSGFLSADFLIREERANWNYNYQKSWHFPCRAGLRGSKVGLRAAKAASQRFETPLLLSQCFYYGFVMPAVFFIIHSHTFFVVHF
jgi:hypothetical protein